jgi:hypothetical protein
VENHFDFAGTCCAATPFHATEPLSAKADAPIGSRGGTDKLCLTIQSIYNLLQPFIRQLSVWGKSLLSAVGEEFF